MKKSIVLLAGFIAGAGIHKTLTTSLFPEYESCDRCRGIFDEQAITDPSTSVHSITTKEVTP